MSEDLSIFIDESGDFGKLSKHSPYYILSLVIHDQSNNIDESIMSLRQSLTYLNYDESHAIHTYPLIRKESPYQNTDVQIRRKIFRRLFSFIRHTNVKVKTFVFDKSSLSGEVLENAIYSAVSDFILENQAKFLKYKNVIFYYDKGQKEIYQVLLRMHYELLNNDEIRIVSPKNYSLFQAADMACTLELLQTKYPNLSKSEMMFFNNARTLKKNYLKFFDKFKI